MNSATAACVVSLSILLAGCQQSAPLSENAEAATPSPAKAGASNPVVVELYQSQGCSSCPPANAAVNAVAGQPGVIALSFAVTYWDRLGWKDTFADKAYTQRQYNYAHAFANPNVYTPQIVINGTKAFTGIKSGELAQNLAKTRPLSGGPSIEFANGNVNIGKGEGVADIWLVRYDPQTHNVPIRSGENTGRTLPHKNVVRELAKLGKWDGDATSFDLPSAKSARLKTVILVQRQDAGAIIAAKIT